jgi:hypothetical protein
MNYTIASTHLLTTVATGKDQKQHPSKIPSISFSSQFLPQRLSETIVLLVVIDTTGTLHLLDPQADGEEMISTSLLVYHNDSRIVVSDVEGESEEGPLLVTGAADGSLHVLGIQVRHLPSPILSLTR